VGIALSATLLQRFTAIHRADLAANVTPFAEATRERIAMISQALIARGDVPAIAQTKAIGFLNGIVTREAMMLSFEQLFLMFGTVFVLSLALLPLMHKSRGMPGSGAAAH
jgi:DHA2 family multidrug resistance protein